MSFIKPTVSSSEQQFQTKPDSSQVFSPTQKVSDLTKQEKVRFFFDPISVLDSPRLQNRVSPWNTWFNFCEWLFDFGQKGYVVTGSTDSATETVKAREKRFLSVPTLLVKIACCATVVLPATALIGKMLYRLSKSFEIQEEESLPSNSNSTGSIPSDQNGRGDSVESSSSEQIEASFQKPEERSIKESENKPVSGDYEIIKTADDAAIVEIAKKIQKKIEEKKELESERKRALDEKVIQSIQEKIEKIDVYIEKQITTLREEVKNLGHNFFSEIGEGINDKDAPSLVNLIEAFPELVPPEEASSSSKVSSPLPEGAPKGIRNLGNSCYMNSFLQVLLLSPEIRAKIAAFPRVKECEKIKFYLGAELGEKEAIALFTKWNDMPLFELRKECEQEKKDKDIELKKEFLKIRTVMTALNDFFVEYDKSKNPSDLRSTANRLLEAMDSAGLIIGVGKQDDPAPVLEYVFRSIGEVLKIQEEKSALGVSQISDNPCAFFQVPVSDVSKEDTLQTLMEKSLVTTQENNEEPWKRDKQSIKKWTETISCQEGPTENFRIQLMRFKVEEKNITRKIERLIDIPEKIDLSQLFGHKKDTDKYEVVSCIIHTGSTVNSGHYRAVTKKNGSWYLCDDSTISLLNDEQAQEWLSQGYIYDLKKVSA